jgi:small subunit ribosomal protein S16
MLAIRMQRTGRSGHAQFRVIVQDSRFSPTRGRVVSYLGSYDPHTKTAQIDSAKAAQYLKNGARPSDTVARLLKKEGVKLPGWVKLSEPRKRDVRKPQLNRQRQRKLQLKNQRLIPRLPPMKLLNR